MNVDRFRKLMMLTTSDVEAEALNALRHANMMLEDEKLTWEQLLDKNNGHKEVTLDDLVREWSRSSQPKPASSQTYYRPPPPRPSRNPNDDSWSGGFKKRVFKVKMKK